MDESGFYSLIFVQCQRFMVGFTAANGFYQGDEPVVLDGFVVCALGLSDKKLVSVVR